MYRGAVFSALLHVFVVIFAYFGLPEMFRSEPVIQEAVPIEVVIVGAKTNVPAPAKKLAQEKAHPAPPKPVPPKPKPMAKALPPPPPPPPLLPSPEPEPKPKMVEPAPPKLAKLPKPAPKKPAPPKAVAMAAAPKVNPVLQAKKNRPKRKPPPPDQLASVLRTVEKLKRTMTAQRPPPEVPKVANVAKVRRGPPVEFDPNLAITISERDAIRRHFERCWNVPAGARDAADLEVEIQVTINPDGWVREAKIVDARRMAGDPFFRAAAESARRAILNPSCRSLKRLNLPAEKYELWKAMTINFNPKQMLGA